MINFCTVAYEKRYRKLSLDLIKSLDKFCENYHLLIMTDDIDFYSGLHNVNISIVEGPNKFWTSEFAHGFSLFSIESAMTQLSLGDVLIYLDCDCVLKQPLTEDNLSNIKGGLNVCIHACDRKLSTIKNEKIKKRMMFLGATIDDIFPFFREGLLIFKIDKNFDGFLKLWKEVFIQITNNHMTHESHNYNLYLIARRSNVIIHHISKERSSKLYGIFYTLAANESGYFPLIA